jgi:hypothetical protein
VEIATRLDELIRGRSTPELTPEEMGRLRRDYQVLHQKYPEKHSIKKTEALETDKTNEYGLFE